MAQKLVNPGYSTNRIQGSNFSTNEVEEIGSTNNTLWHTIVDSTGRELILESNGGAPVNVQDQATTPIDTYFAQSISDFTISVDTGASGKTAATLVYEFEATAGHGIVAGNEVILLDTASDKSLLADVISVATNTIEIDRPIDHDFKVASTLGRIVTTNMAVNGSTTPQIFSARAGTVPIDFTRFLIKILGAGATAMDDSRFGNITALNRGLVFRIVNTFQKTIFNFKTNGEIANYCFDIRYSDKAPAGQHGFSSRITFGGQSKHGVVLRISDDDVLQWVVQDDLTGLSKVQVVGEGHEVTN
jgi:hypothetical protein